MIIYLSIFLSFERLVNDLETTCSATQDSWSIDSTPGQKEVEPECNATC